MCVMESITTLNNQDSVLQGILGDSIEHISELY